MCFRFVTVFLCKLWIRFLNPNKSVQKRKYSGTLRLPFCTLHQNAIWHLLASTKNLVFVQESEVLWGLAAELRVRRPAACGHLSSDINHETKIIKVLTMKRGRGTLMYVYGVTSRIKHWSSIWLPHEVHRALSQHLNTVTSIRGLSNTLFGYKNWHRWRRLGLSGPFWGTEGHRDTFGLVWNLALFKVRKNKVFFKGGKENKTLQLQITWMEAGCQSLCDSVTQLFEILPARNKHPNPRERVDKLLFIYTQHGYL